MKTVVYQSYRTHYVPAWIARCMESVRAWAEVQGFAYRFFDDRMFAYAPAWYRKRVNNHVLLVSDLARLCIAKELLGEFERAIWVDADLVIFDAVKLTIPIVEEYAFCQEIWVYPTDDGTPMADKRVCNALSVFVRGNSILDFYIHACKMIVSRRTEMSPLEVGTNFLTALRAKVPFPILEHVGLFSPAILFDLERGSDAYLRMFMHESATPIYGANLCAGLRNTTTQGVVVNDELFEKVVEKCLHTRGEIINRYLQ